jgi:hypothetical protein
MTSVRLHVLIPTFQRPQALAVTLAGLAAQTLTGVLPSGAVHLELPTSLVNREVECYDRVPW